MLVYLQGHDCRYAVEQAVMSFFPAEKPVWSETAPGPGADGLVSRLEVTDGAVSRAFVCLGGRSAQGEASLDGPLPAEALLRTRAVQRLVKTAVFRAAVALTGETPPWGSLTGVRPGKLAARHMRDQGGDEAAAARWLEAEYAVSPVRAALCARAGAVSLQTGALLGERDIVLYVGVPFCPTRCAYCSFVSHSVEKSFHLIAPYVDALCREIDGVGAVARAAGLRVRAVYFGGGTPTTLSASELGRVMAALAAAFDLAACGEYTVEAGRPDTITRDKLAALRDGGADRISINPQTMDDRVLAAIGRNHSAAQVLAGYTLAREVFPCRINMDLIAGLPADSPAGFAESLRAVLALRPENITVHSLTRKRGARLNQQPADGPDGAQVGQMLDGALAALPQAGYAPYYLYRQKFSAGGFENVGWTLPGDECIYNVCMMEELCPVLSLGAGGATKRVFPETGKILRAFNKKYPYEYIAGVEEAIADKRRLFLPEAD